jgi:hypothetical protein
VGLFWNGANPAAIPFEVDEARSVFGLGLEGVSGDYHRPFDAGSESRTRAAAGGWRPLGARGAGVASAVLDDGSYRRGVFSNGVQPYTSSPYVVADTSGTNLDQLAARLEAAGGWQLGPYGLGLGVGFQGQETRTLASPVPRRTHSAGPGVSGGAVRTFAGGAARLGVFGRWQSLNETVQVHTVAAPTRIYQINGYFEPKPANVSGLYVRWFERESWTVGGGLSGTTLGMDWALWGHRAQAEERQSNERREDPRYDTWRAWSTTLGGSFARRVSGEALLTGTVGWTGLDGEAEPASAVDPGDEQLEDPVVFRVAEQALDLTLDLRAPLGDGRWTLAAALMVNQEWRVRRDSRVGAKSDLDMRTLGASFEVLWATSRGLALSAGAALLSYDPVGGIPDPNAMGPEYRRWIGPEMTLWATPASTRAFTLGVRWDAGPGRAFWLRLGAASTGTRGLKTVLPLLPDGRRSTWNVSGGVTLGD